MIRDQALAVSGLLSDKMGGGPVMPLQPEGVWQVVYNGSQWVTPQNEDRHRRSLYTYWRRTSPYPSFVTFDASSREMCTPRRVTTSTPLQALVTLNDPVYAEASLALARRMQAHGSGLRDRLAWAWRMVTSGPATSATLDRLERLHAEARARYAAQAELAAPVGGEPGIAALSLVAGTLLNLDEALTK